METEPTLRSRTRAKIWYSDELYYGKLNVYISTGKGEEANDFGPWAPMLCFYANFNRPLIHGNVVNRLKLFYN